jgi:dipeptidyl aminopeptidase/acylaminoacyl peptidase
MGRRSLLLRLRVTGMACGLLVAQRGFAQDKQPVTVRDMVEMTKWGDHHYWMGANWDDTDPWRAAQFSPDGTQFAVVLRKGNISDNTNEFSLLVWATKTMFQSPAPDAVLKMTSSSNRDAIASLSWLPDSKTLAFLGEESGELRQLHTYNIRTRILRKLTNSPTNVVSYSVSGETDTIAYLAEEPAREIWDEKATRSGLVVSDEWPSDLVAGRKGGQTVGGGENELFLQKSTDAAMRVPLPATVAPDEVPELSPDGRQILIPLIVAAPQGWRRYTEPSLHAKVEGETLPYMSKLMQFAVFDTATHKIQILLEAPAATTRAVWAPDSHSVVLEDTFLPLSGVEAEERNDREKRSFTVEVEALTGKITKIPIRRPRLLQWDPLTNRLIFRSATQKEPEAEFSADPKRYFEKRNGRWEETEPPSSFKSQPKVILQESMNTPPQLFALDPQTRRRALLFDLNPQFKHLEFGKVQEIVWDTEDGHAIRGGLYFPVGYVAGRRYPLVIQTHHWSKDRFWIDGPWTTAYAAQALAGRGIAVLQAEEPVDFGWWRGLHVTPKEAATQTEIYDRAIDYLDRCGLIDSNRVGILGFSRTSYYVKYALIHAKHHFAAASVTDGIDVGFTQYVLFSGASAEVAAEFAAINAGVPWGMSLQNWVEKSPTFGIDRVKTPVHITALDSERSLLGEWEWFSALRILGKPVELEVIGGKYGAHVLERPWDRLASQEGTVDWFCYWLNGEEDPDPAKSAQYARWNLLSEENHPVSSNATRRPQAR